MKEPKKQIKKIDEKCNKEASDNCMGCIKIIADSQKWGFVEVRNKKNEENPGKLSGIIMGEDRFLEFINKAVASYYGTVAVMDIMQDIALKINREDGGPTKH